MYQQATGILPFAATLWKDVKFTYNNLFFILFTVSFHFVSFQFLYFWGYSVPSVVKFRFHCPLSLSQFLMFELAQSGDGRAVQEILAKSRQIGVDLEEYLNTLLGKC